MDLTDCANTTAVRRNGRGETGHVDGESRAEEGHSRRIISEVVLPLELKSGESLFLVVRPKEVSFGLESWGGFCKRFRTIDVFGDRVR